MGIPSKKGKGMLKRIDEAAPRHRENPIAPICMAKPLLLAFLVACVAGHEREGLDPTQHEGPRHKPEIEDFRGYVEAMDKDKDGLLSLEEAVSSILDAEEGVELAQHPEIKAEQEKHVQQLKANFRKADQNGDGKLTLQEALVLLKHSGGIDIVSETLHTELCMEPESPTMELRTRSRKPVFDCWFESGSMPYASKHYPFEGKEDFEKGFPAQFIAEGLDQTRGWFYTLMVLGTHLFDSPPFQNLIVNGLVLAADGKKMSKRLKNYPDPQDAASEALGGFRSLVFASPSRCGLIQRSVKHGIWRTSIFARLRSRGQPVQGKC
ncbi:unnamed protein product [Effrenium voratum]|nr:unnamed protein product [Effrenium voratum]